MSEPRGAPLLHYYLLVLKQAWMVEAETESSKIIVPARAACTLVATALALLVLRIFLSSLFGLF